MNDGGEAGMAGAAGAKKPSSSSSNIITVAMVLAATTPLSSKNISVMREKTASLTREESGEGEGVSASDSNVPDRSIVGSPSTT